MPLPSQLEAKFTELLGRYPVKRSALIPMMLYAQDHFGYLGDEVLQEIAQRVGLNILEVTETLAYYSMLRRKPAGRYHIQVCTNISCMLRGGNELYQHVQKRLSIKNKEVSPSGTFSLEEVECIGACTGAPAMQVNYDFYENLNPDKIDSIFEQLQDGRKPAPAHRDVRVRSRTASRGSTRYQPAFRHSQLEIDRRLLAERRLPGAGKGAEANDA